MFKSTYFDYKARASMDVPENPWRVQNSALFGRLDRFLERCHDIRDFAQVCMLPWSALTVHAGSPWPVTRARTRSG